MIRALALLLPLGVAGFAVSLHPSGVVLPLGALSLALALGGNAFRRYGLLVAGAAVMAATYVFALVASERALDVWGAALAGAGIYLMLEIGHDHTLGGSVRAGAKTYEQRAAYLLSFLLLFLVGLFFALTLTVNVLERLPGLPPAWLAVPAILLVVGCATVALLFRSRK